MANESREESKWFFARTIREFRKELRLSQDEFAKRIGISRDRLAQIEIGNGQMSDENLGKLVLEFPEIGEPLARRRSQELDRKLNIADEKHETTASKSDILRAIRILEQQRKVLDDLAKRLKIASEAPTDSNDES